MIATHADVGTSAVLLATNVRGEDADFATRSFVAKNVTGTVSIFLDGSAAVTAAADAFRWDVADGPLTFDLEPDEELWGIVVTGMQTVHVLGQGR